MGHGIEKGDMSCSIVVLENEIVANDVVEWSVPINLSKFILVLDQQSCERGRKGFGSASCLEESVWCEWHIWESSITISLAMLVQEN